MGQTMIKNRSGLSRLTGREDSYRGSRLFLPFFVASSLTATSLPRLANFRVGDDPVRFMVRC